MNDVHAQIDRRVLLTGAIDELLLHLRGLVLVRDLLARRGATRAEIDAHSDEIERRQRHLADLIRGQTHPGEALGEAA
jgi:hypothetical protein